MKKFLYVLLVLAMLPVALLVIITPMDSQKQSHSKNGFNFGIKMQGLRQAEIHIARR